jgi:CO/xanthine dehydrogenase Mo-binding subunit
MMEPFATIAAWQGDQLTLSTSNQMVQWSQEALAQILRIGVENIRLDSLFVGGGFGGKLYVRADAVMAALGAKAANGPVKVVMQRPLMANNSTHRAATIQCVRLGAGRDGRLTAIGHESWSGNITAEKGKNGVLQTRMLYAGANRLTAAYIAKLDLPEGNDMRAPGEEPGHRALEVAMDELAEKLGFDSNTEIFADGGITQGNRRFALRDAGIMSAEGTMTYGNFKKEREIGSFAGHFCEVAVRACTGEIRLRRMLAVCDAGRIIDPVSARNQVLGAMTMAAGAALIEELAVDKRFGFFVNHDLASGFAKNAID